jgi:hypothetical protein
VACFYVTVLANSDKSIQGPTFLRTRSETVIISPDLFQHSYTANLNNEERKLTNDKKKVINKWMNEMLLIVG